MMAWRICKMTSKLLFGKVFRVVVWKKDHFRDPYDFSTLLWTGLYFARWGLFIQYRLGDCMSFQGTGWSHASRVARRLGRTKQGLGTWSRAPGPCGDE